MDFGSCSFPLKPAECSDGRADFPLTGHVARGRRVGKGSNRQKNRKVVGDRPLAFRLPPSRNGQHGGGHGRWRKLSACCSQPCSPRQLQSVARWRMDNRSDSLDSFAKYTSCFTTGGSSPSTGWLRWTGSACSREPSLASAPKKMREGYVTDLQGGGTRRRGAGQMLRSSHERR